MKINDLMCTESLDTKVPWTLGYQDDSTQVFATLIDDDYVTITYSTDPQKVLYIDFARNDSSAITGQGNEHKIFGAVVNHIKQYVAHNQPEKIMFKSFKPSTAPFGTPNDSRSNLYKRMVERLANQLGYSYQIQRKKFEDIFILTGN